MDQNMLVGQLKATNSILPQKILKDINHDELARQLASIFEEDRQELQKNPLYRDNFTALVNYIYLHQLSRDPKRRQKNIFSENLITFLLNTPNPA